MLRWSVILPLMPKINQHATRESVVAVREARTTSTSMFGAYSFHFDAKRWQQSIPSCTGGMLLMRLKSREIFSQTVSAFS